MKNIPATKSSDISTRSFSVLSGYYDRYLKRHMTRRTLKRLVYVGIALLILLPLGTYAYYARDIQDRERLMNRNNTGIILKDRNGTAFYSSGLLSTKDDVPLSQISDNVETALIASEDKDFYKHRGFSVRGTGRAFLDNVLNRDVSGSGGSTITQQLVKNKLLGSQKNYLRKYQEVAMALAVERRYTKDEILDMYLNSAYFGDGAFGINDAAYTYFGKSPADLSLAESTMLIGLLPAPSKYSPITGDPALGKKSQRNVLRKMVALNKISAMQRDQVLAERLVYSNDAKKGGADYAQHFADMVIKELEEKFGEERTKRSGFTVTTTLDLSMQKTAEQVVRDQVAKTTARGGSNAGLVSIDPRSGEVLALVGSVDYYNKEFGQVNMATALRQPGSSFKPIYYSDAINRKLITAATVLDDRQMTFGGTYSPKNYDNRYKGKMPVRNALAQSRNVPAVQVMQKETVPKAIEAAKRMGIDSVSNPDRYGLSLALGTAEVRLLQMTSAYGSFANNGKHYQPVMYRQVVDKYGKTVAKPHTEKPKQVLSPEAAYIMSSILSDNAARAPTFGTTLNIPGKTVALKTGTTNDNKDAWTIGFTPSVVTGVWLGNNANQPMRGLAGGSSAGIIWKIVMTQYLKGKANQGFKQPKGISQAMVCSDGTSFGGSRMEYFIRGTEPSESCRRQTTDEQNPKKDEKEDKKQDEPQKPDEKKQEDKPKPQDQQPPDDGSDDGETPPTTDPGTTTPPPSPPPPR